MKSIFLAGAHTEGVPLPELVAEIRELENILHPLNKTGGWKVLSNRAANLADVFDTFSSEGENMIVFHYAGHANQQELHIEGGGQVRGIAELFGLAQGKTLQFVFLNGCASEGMVSDLHEAGVGAVIATSRPIDDLLARDFAKCFYKTWAMEGKTLEQAFRAAVAFVHSKPVGNERDIVLKTRSFGRAKSSWTVAIPWGLYLNSKFDNERRQQLLSWSLSAGRLPWEHPLQHFPKGPMVDFFVVDRDLPAAYANYFKASDAQNVVLAAIALHNSIKPDPVRATGIRLADLPPPATVAPIVYWNQVFNEACLHGPRMLAAVLLVVPADLFSQHIVQLRQDLLEKLRHWV